jgi:phosphoenolpyruvate synthase/pyruvate phosphate dikinase
LGSEAKLTTNVRVAFSLTVRDPASIQFFEKVGLDYVSCSPYRVPVARLAAAQAALQVKVGD